MRVLPDASSYVIFELAGEMAGAAYLVGTLLRPVLVAMNGNVDRVGIKLRPGTASLLLGVSAADARNRVVSLADASIPFPSLLLHRLSTTPSLQSRAGVLEEWLRGRLSRLKPSALTRQSETAHLFNAVVRGANPRVLTELTGWNERKTQRFFLEHYGASAATLNRWSRFRRALSALEAGRYPSRAILAAHLGYSDQAHMCREFREFAGTDIRSLLSERQRVGNIQAAGQ